jgi:putative PEP-CTERM system histidine kinase
MHWLEVLTPEQLGFLVAALAYFVSALLILATRSRNVPKIVLLSFIISSFIWALYYGISQPLPYSTILSKTLELLRQLTLILFLMAALQAHSGLRQFIVQPNSLLLFAITFGWYLLSLNLSNDGSLLYSGSLAFCVLQLALLEALYRKASEAERWQFKPLVIALAASIIFDFVLLAESALFARVDLQLWQARGFVFALLVPVLTLSIRRISAWQIRVFISRDVVLQSTLVLAAGLYLCLLALTGFYLRYFGGSWSDLLQISFVVLGFALMLLLLFSGTVRRNIKVFIEKHFFANRFDYREQWLALTRGLRAIKLSQADRYKEVLSVWLSSINYRQGTLLCFQPDGQIKVLALLGRTALTNEEQQLLQRYYLRYQNQYWQLDLTEPTTELTVNLDTSQLHFQLLLPIRTPDGLWGACLMQTEAKERLKLNWELRDYLNVVSEQISALLQLMHSSDKLSENAQFAAFSRMSAFVVHDLKNVKAQLDLLIKNAAKHRHNPEFIEDSFTTLAAMQQRLEHMLQQLSSKQAATEQRSSFYVGQVIAQLIVERCAAKLPVPKLHLTEDCLLTLDQHRFANVIYHLLDNAQHATAENGQINLYLDAEPNLLTLRLQDTGCGMTADFIEQRLFKPFDTTKGNAGMGIGVYDAKTFIEQAGGTLTVSSEPGVGTTFSIRLPLHSSYNNTTTAAPAGQGL